MRPTRADIDLGAIEANTARLVERAAGSTVCAVVKANGYGHGAVDVARAALAGGAEWLGVALVEEAERLRDAHIEAPILLLSEPPPGAVGEVVRLGVRPTIYSTPGVDAYAAAANSAEAPPVHVKVNTGMNRVGAHPDDLVDLVRYALDAGLDVEGVWTHFAVADAPEDTFTHEQEQRFDRALTALRVAGVEPPMTHTANSAATIARPSTHRDLVRVGIALYGVAPSPALDGAIALDPAMTLRSTVSWVKRVDAGEGISYGRRHRFAKDTNVATVPIGYADGVPRRLAETGGQVLIGGRRRGIVGVVTMDQLMVDVADDDIAVGEEVVLLGAQGDERIRPEEWAERLGTIGYEIVCGVSDRVPRHPV